ncbi:MAG: hypothetical protein V3W44_09535 [Dehalococcoidales bacterium]
MAATVANVKVLWSVGGGLAISGRATLSATYLTGGETLDLSSYFQGSPLVIPTGDDGYVIEHDRGNAAAGKLLARFANGGAAAGAALIELTNAVDTSAVICSFIAVGDHTLS